MNINNMTIKFKQRDLSFAKQFAAAEKYHLLSFSDGASSTDHLIRVVELENAERDLSTKLEAFSSGE